MYVWLYGCMYVCIYVCMHVKNLLGIKVVGNWDLGRDTSSIHALLSSVELLHGHGLTQSGHWLQRDPGECKGCPKGSYFQSQKRKCPRAYLSLRLWFPPPVRHSFANTLNFYWYHIWKNHARYYRYIIDTHTCGYPERRPQGPWTQSVCALWGQGNKQVKTLKPLSGSKRRLETLKSWI